MKKKICLEIKTRQNVCKGRTGLNLLLEKNLSFWPVLNPDFTKLLIKILKMIKNIYQLLAW